MPDLALANSQPGGGPPSVGGMTYEAKIITLSGGDSEAKVGAGWYEGPVVVLSIHSTEQAKGRPQGIDGLLLPAEARELAGALRAAAASAVLAS